MPRIKSWILTDLAADVWLDSFHVAGDDFPESFATAWQIDKRTLRGGRRDGVDLIEVNNGTLSFSILPTRGMGLWRGNYRGLHLGWRAPIQGPVHPRHVNLLDRGGLGWLDGFDEWICRCGLSSNGPPGADPKTNETLPLHGRIANQPAHYVEVRVNLVPPHELTVIGQVDEATLFFTGLRLTTTIVTTPGSNRLLIQDVVENLRHAPAELELLYHCQFGPPLLEAGSVVEAPIHEVAPRDTRAVEGIAAFNTCMDPTPGFAEQVYFYDLLTDSHGHTLALLHNQVADKGVALRFSRTELPCFTVWKNAAAVSDGYVTGLEPSTDFPNFRAFEREQGRLALLPPGGRHQATLCVEVHDSALGVANVRQEIAALQRAATPLVHPLPRPGWSA
jgi:hypothetical protein